MIIFLRRHAHTILIEQQFKSVYKHAVFNIQNEMYEIN